MIINALRSLLFFSFLIFVFSCSSTPKRQPSKTPIKKTVVTNPEKPVKPKEDEILKITLPPMKREFRAAWVASVANINWPSRKDLSTAQQKEEAIRILEVLKNNNFNAVILQIRPSADALYRSPSEPWSYFLTGEIGKAPSPFYDPLEFWIEEAHKRGIEIHAWLNPYRVHHTGGGKVTKESMVYKSPDNVVRLKNGMYWFDPASKKTQDHVSAVVKDLIKRYDIDGIHFDDYFYPYASYNNGADFPDTRSWNDYKANGGSLSRADFRREAVNNFVERIYKEIKTEKNYVKFGISPFGIWKPGYPSGITGSSQYDELYADAKLWLNKGWIDYFSPQLYWPINSKGQSFGALLNWWQSENTKKRHLWPGLNTVEVKAPNRTAEITDEIALIRQTLKNDPGEIHWSVAGLTNNSSMLPALKNGLYRDKALIPQSPWLKSESIATPSLSYEVNGNSIKVNWKTAFPKQAFLFVLFTKYGDQWETEILSKDMTTKELQKSKSGKSLSLVAVKVIDRLSNESDYNAVRIK